MNLKTAARRLGVHYQTAYHWVRSGDLEALKVGAHYDVSEAALARFVARHAGIEHAETIGTDEASRCPAVVSYSCASAMSPATLDAPVVLRVVLGDREVDVAMTAGVADAMARDLSSAAVRTRRYLS